ncbi:ribosomal protection-like ABC-F family protein [Lederbergia ruris]|uniref:ribosomal protection-like ABC-F family protein n=1 Tax=Lederbergia ruris TaxID=217495 RepID=UPI00399F51CF
MSTILELKGIGKEWNGQMIFSDVNLEVSFGERIALIGKNGVGKTTLLSIILGRVNYDLGTVNRFLPLPEFGYLEQELQTHSQINLIDFVKAGIETQELNENIGHTHASNSARVYKHLKRIGLPENVWDIPYCKLSGGQKTKAQLIRLVLQQPKLLILDEPTNHLDLKSLLWLENWLCRYPGTVLFVSHDRNFIDQVATSTIVLKREGTKRYAGGYSTYKDQLSLELKTKQALYEKQHKERQKLLDSIKTYQTWFEEKSRQGEKKELRSRLAHRKFTQKKLRNRMRAKEQELNRLESRIIDPPTEEPTFQLNLDAPQQYMKTLLRLENVSFGYTSDYLFSDVELEVRRGERIAVIGENGTGKTTLLKLLAGNLPASKGEVKYHPSLHIGFLDQELTNLNMNQPVIDTILEFSKMSIQRAQDVLSSYMFGPNDWSKLVGNLSMGERCRLSLLQMVLSEANLLILDEPTNYLDVQSREEVETCLQDYPGTLIFVSHDRYFLRKIANRVLTITDSRIQKYLGTYEEWVHHSNVRKKGLDTEVENRIRQLEFRLSQMMAKPTHKFGSFSRNADNNNILREIREVQEEIAQLRDFGKGKT